MEHVMLFFGREIFLENMPNPHEAKTMKKNIVCRQNHQQRRAKLQIQ